MDQMAALELQHAATCARFDTLMKSTAEQLNLLSKWQYEWQDEQQNATEQQNEAAACQYYAGPTECIVSH